MDKTCRKLKSDFDVSILDTMPEKTKKIFIDTSKECLDKNIGNLGLAKMIMNHFSKVKHVEKIEWLGPLMNIYHYEKSGTKVYLIGENHKEVKCDRDGAEYITQFYKQLFEHTDKFIDFYIEISPNKPNYQLRSNAMESGLTNIVHEFKNEIYHLPGDRYPNVRFHWSDLRFYLGVHDEDTGELTDNTDYNTDYTLSMYLREFISAVIRKTKTDVVDNVIAKKTYKYSEGELGSMMDVYDTSTKRILDAISGKNNLKKYFRNFLKTPSKITSKINKELSKIDKKLSSKLKKLIIQVNADLFMEYKLKNDQKKLEKIIEWIKSGLDTEITLEELNGVYILSILFNFIADFYLIFRIFKKYKSKQDPKYAKNILIHTGAYHTFTYVKIFEKMGFNLIESVESDQENKDYRCVNISQMKQPFFN